MTAISIATKKAYFARVRRSNYAASLRLEGFRSEAGDAGRDLPSREVIVRHYCAKAIAPKKTGR